MGGERRARTKGSKHSVIVLALPLLSYYMFVVIRFIISIIIIIIVIIITIIMINGNNTRSLSPITATTERPSRRW